MKVRKKQERNFVQEERQQLKQNLKFIQALTQMVTQFKFVRGKCLVQMAKNIAQGLIVNSKKLFIFVV